MSITLFGSASNPADTVVANEPVTSVITPPASMVAGQKVFMLAVWKVETSGLGAISEAGGQTWADHGESSGNGLMQRLWSCTFNGTWSASPSIAFAAASGTVPCSAIMHVADESVAGSTWSLDNGPTFGNFTAPGSPFTVTWNFLTFNVSAGSFVLAWFVAADDNTFGSLTGTGWAVAGSAQYRNPAGSDLAVAFAWLATSVTGEPATMTMNMSGSDAGISGAIAFKSTPPAGFAPPVYAAQRPYFQPVRKVI